MKLTKEQQQEIADQQAQKNVTKRVTSHELEKILYDAIDSSEFYLGAAHPDHRSIMNVTFNLANNDLLPAFLSQAESQGLYALKGHRVVGGARASIYNAMPVAGCQALADFMKNFEKNNA